MPYKVRLFLREGKPQVDIATFHSPTPQIGDRMKVPLGNSIVEAKVIGVFRNAHHSERMDLVDAYEEPPAQLAR